MDSYKRLFKNSVIFGIGNFGSKLINVLLVPFYTYYLSVSDYGLIDLSITTLNMLLPVVTLSIYDSVLRFSMDKKSNYMDILKTALLFVSIINSLIVLSVIFISNIMVVLTLIILILQTYQSTLSQFARACGKTKLFAFVGIVMTIITAASNIILIAVLDWGVQGYFISMIIANIVAITILICRVNIFSVFREGKLDFSLLRKMLRYSIPLIPNSLMWWLTNASGRYFILFFLGPVQNGLYAVATKVPTILSMFTNVFSQAWQLSAIEEFDSEKKSDFYSNVMRYYYLILMLGSSGILIIVQPLFLFAFNEQYYSAWKPVPFLLISIIFLSLCSFLGTNYIAAKETKGVFKTTLVSGGVNVLLNFTLTPFLGIMGTALSTMISYIVLFIYRLQDTKKYVKITIDLKVYVYSTIVFFSQTFFLFFIEKAIILLFVEGVLFILNVVVFYKDIKILLKRRGKV